MRRSRDRRDHPPGHAKAADAVRDPREHPRPRHRRGRLLPLHARRGRRMAALRRAQAAPAGQRQGHPLRRQRQPDLVLRHEHPRHLRAVHGPAVHQERRLTPARAASTAVRPTPRLRDRPRDPHPEHATKGTTVSMISSQPETKKVSLDTELRNAAAKLRKHVKHATDSPWVTSSVWSPLATSTSAVYSHAHPAGTVDSEVVASGRIRSGYGGIREPWNAEYIALMQPSVGAALADLLDIEATVVASRIAEDGTDEYAADFGTDHLLQIARLINGEQGGAA